MMRMDDLAAQFEADGGGPVAIGLRREWMNPEVVAHFTVDGEPQSKARARVTMKNGKATAYTPRQTQAAEEAIGWAFRQAKGRGPNAVDTFGVFAVFFCGTRQRRDVDNMVKLVFDGLTGVAWEDDSQVTEVAARLQRGVDKADARSEVIVYKTRDELHRTKRCVQCGKAFRIYESTKQIEHCSQQCAGMSKRTHDRTCAYCGERCKGGNWEFCSAQCKTAGTTQHLTCAVCGTQFTAFRSLGRRFCSRACAYVGRRSRWDKEAS